MVRIFPYSVQIRENTNQKNSEYGRFSRSGGLHIQGHTYLNKLAAERYKIA